MYRITAKMLLISALCALAMVLAATSAFAQNPAGLAPALRPRVLRSRSGGTRAAFALNSSQPTLPSTATPAAITTTCPDAASPGTVCGYVAVPLDRSTAGGPTIPIYFEIYSHSQKGPAQSAIMANLGGPSLTTTGLRQLWLGLFGPSMDVHDLLLVDDRGRGQSATINCTELQNGTGTSFSSEVADCAAQLGAEASFFSTGDVAKDTEAVRQALGYNLIDYYGGSYGGVDVAAYATRFGSHLRSVILDSAVGAAALQPFQLVHDSAISSTRAVTLDCSRSPTCSVDHPSVGSEWAELVEDIQSRPISGSAYDQNGNPISVTVDGPALLIITQSGNLYVDMGELLAAGAAHMRGDDVPLLRLSAEGILPEITNYGDPTFLSAGAYTATASADLDVPFSFSSPIPRRLQRLAVTAARLPRHYFAPFSTASTTQDPAQEGPPLTNEYIAAYWQEPSPFIPPIPRRATYPSIPVLSFAADIDTSVPVEFATTNTRLFPNSTYLTVAEGCHESVTCTACASGIANQFIETLQPGDTSCTNTPETVWPAVGRFPFHVADARPAAIDPSGLSSAGTSELEAVTVTVSAALDVLKRVAIGGGTGVCLRGGTFTTNFTNTGRSVALAGCRFSEDLAVDGTVFWGTDNSVTGTLTASGAANGQLTITGFFLAPGPVANFSVSGRMNRRAVSAFVPEG